MNPFLGELDFSSAGPAQAAATSLSRCSGTPFSPRTSSSQACRSSTRTAPRNGALHLAARCLLALRRERHGVANVGFESVAVLCFYLLGLCILVFGRLRQLGSGHARSTGRGTAPWGFAQRS